VIRVNTIIRDLRWMDTLIFNTIFRIAVFFGHYWLKDRPEITAPNAACLDFSVAKQGYLTAYRWSGELNLTKNSLVAVPA
jgi:hypothetical protein